MSMLIRLPNWLGDVVMALPIVRALAQQHPQLSLSGQATFAPLLTALGFTQSYHAIPQKNWAYYWHFFQQRNQFEQTVLFTNSQRSDWEAWLQNIPKRYGIAWKERPRRLINYRYEIQHPEQDGKRHQSQLWADFTAHFSLQNGVSFAPLLIEKPRKNHIILICGSENNPEKRWPIAHWQQLIHALREHTTADILLCGTSKDHATCQTILQSITAHNVHNLAGATHMLAFLELLEQAHSVIGNDTGGLHLANAVATPTIGLYGPTNPQRTRPIYQAPLAIVQPEDCPAHGGGNMADIQVAQVIRAWKNITSA